MPSHKLVITLNRYDRWSGEDVLKIRKEIDKFVHYTNWNHQIDNWDRFLVDESDIGYKVIDTTDESVFVDGLNKQAANEIASAMNVRINHTGSIKAGK